MRYFNEDKTYVGQSYDAENYTVKETDVNNITFAWQVDQEREVETVVDWAFPDGTPGDTHDEEITPEVGHWEYDGDYDGEDVKRPSILNPHDKPQLETETVTIIRPLTAEEKAERQRQREEEEARQQEAQQQAALREAFITNLMNNNADTANITNDQASTETYEALTENENITIKNTEPFSQAYARRVNRKELEIEDCPSELQSRIAEIVDSGLVCDFTAHITHGTFSTTGLQMVTDIDKDINRYQTVTLLIVADDTYRVPTQDEFTTKATFDAKDDDGNVIDDYFKKYCTYGTTNTDNTAVVRIAITKDAATINFNYNCIKKVNIKKPEKK